MTVHNLARKLFYSYSHTCPREQIRPKRHLPTQTHFICNQTLKQLENLTFSEPTSQQLHLQSQTNNSIFKNLPPRLQKWLEVQTLPNDTKGTPVSCLRPLKSWSHLIGSNHVLHVMGVIWGLVGHCLFSHELYFSVFAPCVLLGLAKQL